MAGILDLLLGRDDRPSFVEEAMRQYDLRQREARRRAAYVNNMPNPSGNARSGNDMANRDPFVRMIAGMDNPRPMRADIPELGDPLAGQPEPKYDWRKETRERYKAQRGMRGLSSLAFGSGDLLNDFINAGIRDVDYFTGGGLSGGTYEPYQLGAPSQTVADVAAMVSGADIVPRELVPPSTQRAGDWVEAGVGMLPIGAGALAPMLKGGTNIAGKGLKNLASRTVDLYHPPVKEARKFNLDYPSAPKSDDAGRLLEDIEGRPLTAETVVGRRMVGREDVAVSPSQYDAITEATIGSVPAATPARALPRKAVGAFRERYSPEGFPVYDIRVLKTLSPDDAQMVTAHEMGHMFDSLAREWAHDPKAAIPSNARSELLTVYNDLNNPDLAWARERGWNVELNPRKYKGYGPERLGYKPGQDSDAELVAEAFRAYMADPNYMKTVAPNGAKWIRERVNPHPQFKDIIQFNSLAAAMAPVGLLGYLAEQQEGQ